MIDHIAGVLELLGIWLVGRKKKSGFLFAAAGGIVWIIAVIRTGVMFGLLIVVLPALGLNVYNYFKWGRDNGKVHNGCYRRACFSNYTTTSV